MVGRARPGGSSGHNETDYLQGRLAYEAAMAKAQLASAQRLGPAIYWQVVRTIVPGWILSRILTAVIGNDGAETGAQQLSNVVLRKTRVSVLFDDNVRQGSLPNTVYALPSEAASASMCPSAT